MTPVAKLGLSAGIGSLSSILTNSALKYWAPTADATGATPWYQEYSSLLGGAVSLAAAGVLWKTWGKEEALVCALAGIGTALAIPAQTYVVNARAGTLGNLRMLAGQAKQLARQAA